MNKKTGIIVGNADLVIAMFGVIFLLVSEKRTNSE